MRGGTVSARSRSAVLLIAVAIVLVTEVKSLLLGESASPHVVDSIVAALTGGGIDRVIHLRTMHLGPEELLVAAKVAMPPTRRWLRLPHRSMRPKRGFAPRSRPLG